MLDRGTRDLGIWHVGLNLILISSDLSLEDELVYEIGGAARRRRVTIRAVEPNH